jgi:dipeptidyl aminopeptidase/acylaminoacyl peptidase
MSPRRAVIGAVAAVVLVFGTLWATGALDPSNGATSAVPSGASILHEGEVLELADDGMTLVATDMTTRHERMLARCTDCAYVRRFEPSAGGRWLAYEALTCDQACWPSPPGAGLWVVGAQGRRIHVTTTSGSAWAWSPTTERFAYVGAGMHGTELILLDPSTRDRTSITTTGGAIYDLAWSPDGSTIAYAATSLVGVNLVHPGANSQRIRGSLAPSWRSGGEDLVWSPDGTRLAVTTQRAGVAVVRIDGSGTQRVLDRRPQHIAWSPDGRRLAFVDGHDVGVVSAIGGAALILTSATRTPAFWSGLAWSPDGSLVAYTQGAGRPWYSVSSDVRSPSEHIDRLQVDRWIQGR